MVKTNIPHPILGLVLFLMLFGNIRSQEYYVSIWSIPVGSGELTQISDNEISLKLKSTEFIDYVFPIDLDYYSKFDKNNYTIIENKKTTEQKTEEQNFEAILDDNNVLVYNDQDSISLEPNTHSLLSLLVRFMNSSVDSIPFTPRQLEAFVRLAEASARIRLSEEVTIDDAKRAISTIDQYLRRVGMDRETGKIDIDIIATGISHSQHDRMRTIMDIIQRLCDESKDGDAARNEIIIEAETSGFAADKVKEALDRLKRNGQIYEPVHNRYKITEY